MWKGEKMKGKWSAKCNFDEVGRREKRKMKNQVVAMTRKRRPLLKDLKKTIKNSGKRET